MHFKRQTTAHIQSTRNLTEDEVDDLHPLQEIALNLKNQSEQMDRRFQPAEQFHEAVVECVRRSTFDKDSAGKIYAIGGSTTVQQLVGMYKDAKRRGQVHADAARINEESDTRYTSWMHQHVHLLVAIWLLEAAEEEVVDSWTLSSRK